MQAVWEVCFHCIRTQTIGNPICGSFGTKCSVCNPDTPKDRVCNVLSVKATIVCPDFQAPIAAPIATSFMPRNIMLTAKRTR